MKSQKISTTLTFLVCLISFVLNQNIPSLAPVKTTLNAQSSYTMKFFSLKKFQKASYFRLDFTQTEILVPNGNLTTTAQIKSVPIAKESIQSFCQSKVCTIKIGQVPALSNLNIEFGSLTNPKYISTQTIPTFIYYSANQNETHLVSIASNNYQPMPITVNSVEQSDKGVGTQDVTYTFNVSFSYIPRNPEIYIQVPSEIGYQDIKTSINFYGKVQNIEPTFTVNIISLRLISLEIPNPEGYMLLTLEGFRNPIYIGKSSSFNITMGQRQTSTSNNCITCKVAILYANATKLIQISSQIPGDVSANSISSSNNLVSAVNNVTVGVKIVAPIPVGGKFRVILPALIQPNLPVSCVNVFGFTTTPNSSCIYDETKHTIDTVGYSFPYMQQAAVLYLQIQIINPPTNQETQLRFESMDDQNRVIGRSRQPSKYSATPLPLQCQVVKSNTSIQSPYTLTGKLTLNRSLTPSSDHLIYVNLPPSQFYNLSAIKIFSGSLTLKWTSEVNTQTGSLSLRFNPPCSECIKNTTISFSISNLINPSYINQQMESVQIQTGTINGAIQSGIKVIPMKKMNLDYFSYDWINGEYVGQKYNLEVFLNMPTFLRKHGGHVEFSFSEGISFVNPSQNGATFTYPTQVLVQSQKNTSLVNFVEFYQPTLKIPKSLKKISVKVCTEDSQCPTAIKIKALRKPFYSPDSMQQTMQTTTLNGDPISIIKIDCLKFTPKAYQSDLFINISNSVVNEETNYMLNFTVKSVPIGSQQLISLSSQHKIKQDGTGRCFVEVWPRNSLSFGIDCFVINETQIKLNFSGDSTRMMLSDLTYSVTIVGVINPHSIKKLSYSVPITYKGKTSNIFSTMRSVQYPFSLGILDSLSSNQTIGKVTTMSIDLLTNYYPFDQLKITIPKKHFTHFIQFLGKNASAPSAGYSLSQNSTHFVLSEIYKLPESHIVNQNLGGQVQLTLQMTNSFQIPVGSCVIFMDMYVQGYLSSSGQIILQELEPVYLEVSSASSMRTVGQKTQIQINVSRVNYFASQKYFRIMFNNEILRMDSILMNSSYSEYQYKGQSLFNYTQEISGWSLKNFTFANFQNMMYLPSTSYLSQLSNIQVLTLDSNFIPISRSIVPKSSLIPLNAASSKGGSFIRSGTQSNVLTNISLNIQCSYPEKMKRLRITLPDVQNMFQIGITKCFINGDTTKPCKIIEMDASVMIIEYQENWTILLTSVLNLYSSGQKMKTELLTDSNDLIQKYQKAIAPSIELDAVEVSLQTNTSVVASSVKLDFVIKNVQNEIEIGSILRINFPRGFYTKLLTLNSQDCQYQINSFKYTGCQYKSNQTDGTLQQVSITNIGSQTIRSGSLIKASIFLTNPQSAYQFKQNYISIVFTNLQGQHTSSGLVMLSSIYPNLNSFQTVDPINATLIESSKVCGQVNLQTFGFSLNVPIFKGSFIQVALPRHMVTFNNKENTVGYEYSQDSTNFYLKRPITCEPLYQNNAYTPICRRYNPNFSFSINVTNSQFIRNQFSVIKALQFYMYSTDQDMKAVAITTSKQLMMSDRIISPLNQKSLSLQRSQSLIGAETIVTLDFSVDISTLESKNFKVSVQPDQHKNSLFDTVSSVQYEQLNDKQIFGSSNALRVWKTQYDIIINLENVKYNDIRLKIKGTNSRLALLNASAQKYIISLYSESPDITYYSNKAVPVFPLLAAYSNGLTLHSSITLVDSQSIYRLRGFLPEAFNDFKYMFNNSVEISLQNSTSSINQTLGYFMNPPSSNWDIKYQVKIFNQTNLLYENKKLEMSEKIQSLSLPAGTVKSIKYNSNMIINSEEIIEIIFWDYIQIKDFILKTPSFYTQVLTLQINDKQTIPASLFSIRDKILTNDQNETFTQKQLNMKFFKAKNISRISLNVTTPSIQVLFLNRTLSIETQLPTKSYTEPFRANVYGSDDFAAELITISERVNVLNNFTVIFTPIYKIGMIKLYYPKFMNSKIKSQLEAGQTSQIVQKFNSVEQNFTATFDALNSEQYFTQIQLTAEMFPIQIEFQFINFKNPDSNEPFQFLIQQSQINNDSQIYGRRSLPVIISQLEPIQILKAERNSSKIDETVSIQLEIKTPQNINFRLEKCFISLPSSQVTLDDTGTCTLRIIQNSKIVNLPCSVAFDIPNTIYTTCYQGLYNYQILQGFKNVLYSAIPNQYEKPLVYIGSPYRKAQSLLASTSFLEPIVTAGNLELNKITLSSYVRLETTNLILDMTLENLDQIDCIRITFEEENFLIQERAITCRIEGKVRDCWTSESYSIYINSSKISKRNLNISIKGLINFVSISNFTVETLSYLKGGKQSAKASSAKLSSAASDFSPAINSADYSNFAKVDVFYSTANQFNSSFRSSANKVRIINSENYVSGEKKNIKVIYDSYNKVSSMIDERSLRFNISSNLAGCQQKNQLFSNFIEIECIFDRQMTLEVKVELFHEKFNTVALQSTTKDSLIYPALSPICVNQKCDTCSSFGGREYCFGCREYLYEYNGNCVESCPDGYTRYRQSSTCEKCSLACQSCFDIFINSCLKCSQNLNFNYDGTCFNSKEQTCPTGYPQNGFCIGDEKCYDSGCALCSSTGFCYQCLPDYTGEPVCEWQPLLPSIFMTYWTIPFWIFAVFSALFVCVKKGTALVLNQALFSFSLLQFSIWIFIIPAFHNKEETFLMLALIILRIMIGVVSYETHYKKQLGIGLQKTSQQESMIKNNFAQNGNENHNEVKHQILNNSNNEILSQKKCLKNNQKNNNAENQGNENECQNESSLEENPCLLKTTLFLAHFIGPDAFGQIKVLNPKVRVQDKGVFNWFMVANRIIVWVLLGYVWSMRILGDLSIMPLMTLSSGLAVWFIGIIRSESFFKCFNKLRAG